MADFYDHVKIHVKAGDGGNGAIAFHREKYISHGGDRKSTRLNSSHTDSSRMPSSA